MITSRKGFQTLASPAVAPEIIKGRLLTLRNQEAEESTGELLAWGISLGELAKIRPTA